MWYSLFQGIGPNPLFGPAEREIFKLKGYLVDTGCSCVIFYFKGANTGCFSSKHPLSSHKLINKFQQKLNFVRWNQVVYHWTSSSWSNGIGVMYQPPRPTGYKGALYPVGRGGGCYWMYIYISAGWYFLLKLGAKVILLVDQYWSTPIKQKLVVLSFILKYFQSGARYI